MCVLLHNNEPTRILNGDKLIYEVATSTISIKRGGDFLFFGDGGGHKRTLNTAELLVAIDFFQIASGLRLAKDPVGSSDKVYVWFFKEV